MKVSDYVIRYLAERKVRFVFEMAGGMIAHLLDSIHQQKEVVAVSMHHEQAAAFAADGFSRMSGIPGIAMATSGPGATNLLTGIGSCFFDSSPTVFLTGQVNRQEQKGKRPIRQLGFQETDIVSIAQPITKAAWQARQPEEVPSLLARAFALALEGRPGPVLLDLPMDIQRSEICDEQTGSAFAESSRGSTSDSSFISDLIAALEKAKRPLVLAGGGIRSSGCTALFREFAQAAGIPVVTSLLGLDSLAHDASLRVGMIGSYGNRWANMALASADLLLVLGSRLDIRQTGSDTKGFKGEREIFHVDCDAGEMNNRIIGCRTLVADLRDFLPHAIRAIRDRRLPKWQQWFDRMNSLRQAWPDTAEFGKTEGINPNKFMHALSLVSEQAAAYVVDVGQHQMWAAQSLEIRSNQRFITSGGMGSMGFALPASIGTALCIHPQPVVVIAGDGGFQANIQELQTVVRNNLPLKIVVINNLCHGMVRQFQESYFERRYQSTMWGYSSPDFSKVAKAYGIQGETIRHPKEIDGALKWLWKDPMAPRLLQVMVDPKANAYPKLAFGRPLAEMEPFLKPNR